MEILKLATLSINGLTSQARTAVLDAFVHLHNFDVLLLHEVTHPLPTVINGYNIYYNIGTKKRGTAILSRDAIPLINISKLPSGRAIAASLGTLSIINIYALSGTAKRTERETFFNNELPYLLRSVSDELILGGDFHCVLEAVTETSVAP